MSEYSAELKLKEPLAKEDWDIIADTDFKHTSKVTFTTPHCGEVEFVKVVRCKDCKYYEAWEKDGDRYCTHFSADPYEYLPMEDDDFCSRGERSEDERTCD